MFGCVGGESSQSLMGFATYDASDVDERGHGGYGGNGHGMWAWDARGDPVYDEHSTKRLHTHIHTHTHTHTKRASSTFRHHDFFLFFLFFRKCLQW